MARRRFIQNNFTAGEFSPRLSARVDFAKYNNAAETMENFLILPHGGATRRPGTLFVAEVKDSTKKVRLIPFQFSITQAYIIEVGNLYKRFYTLNGQLQSAGTPVEITTPYTEPDIFGIHFAQSADILYLAHPNYEPRKLKRLSATSFQLDIINFIDGPYLKERTDITLTPSATTGTITITASASLFTANHVGALFRIKHGATWGYVKVTAFTSATQVTADVKTTLGGTTASTAFREGAWSKEQGFPRAVTFFEERLYWAGTKNNPQSFWGSAIDDFENHTPGTADSDAVTFTIASNQVNAILWLATAQSLILGTAGGEFQALGGTNKAIGPANVLVKGHTTFGSTNIRPIKVGNTILFVQSAKRKLREFVFNLDEDSFTAPDLTILAEHITKGGIIDMAYQQELDSIVWAVRADGVLLSMTFLRKQDVIAWARHITDGKFESVAVIPHPNGDEDQTWILVNRTINGVTKRYIEFFNTKEGFYGPMGVDSGLIYNGAAVATLTGLSHLNGKSVDIVGNGAIYPRQTISGGQVTGLDPTVTQAEVGLSFVSKIATLKPELDPQQTIQGIPISSDFINVRLYQTLGVKINGDPIPFRVAKDLMGKPPPIFTGDKKISRLKWDEKAQITIEQEQPLPCTVLAIMRTLETGDV